MPKARITVFIEEDQKETLEKLSAITRVNQAVYVREALDDLFKKYAKVLRKGGYEGRR
jgi:lipopolysaccharide biosynthesis glycosyltransferase